MDHAEDQRRSDQTDVRLQRTAEECLLGWLFDTTGNLVAPVVAHTTINAVNLWLLSNRHAP